MKGKNTIITGYTGEGKTELALHFVQKHIASGIQCVFFSLELSKGLFERHICEFNKSRNLNLNDTSLLDIRDIPAIPIESIIYIVKEYLSKQIKPAVFIDYLELAGSTTDGKWDYSEHMKTSLSSIRKFADQFGVDFFIVIHTKRKFKFDEKKHYTLSQIPYPDVSTYADRILFVQPSASGLKTEFVVCKGEVADSEI